jgi:uncharacterized protein (TIGR02001 family)
MNRLIIAAALAIPGGVLAQQAASSPHTVTGNMSIVSDYRFRGISQTFRGPAIQGGIDYSHSSGFYLGTWDSSVSGLSYLNGSGIEMDFYGGWKGEVAKDVNLDVGLLQYYYPNARIVSGTGDKTKYDTLELYVGASYKWLSAKYSHTLSNYFGVKSETFGGVCNRDGVDCFDAAPGNSKGSGYLDVSASYEVMPKLTLVAHVGSQKVKNYSKLDYTDYKLGVTYDMQGWLLGAALVGTNADEKFYFLTDGSGRTKEIGKTAAVLSVSKTF